MEVKNMQKAEERLENIEKRLARLEARMEVENLAGKYARWMAEGRFGEILEKLWSRRRDRTLEEGAFGVYSDTQLPLFGLDSYYNQRYGMPVPGKKNPEQRGRMTIVTFSSPDIAIDESGMTAAGSWMCVGNESRVWFDGDMSALPSVDAKPADKDGRRHAAFWVWQRYQAEFIQEDRQWKIWKMHIWDIFRCPYDEDWISYAGKRYADDEYMDSQIRFGDNPTHSVYPTTEHWQYAPDRTAPRWPDQFL